jgi:hypothetical protein
MTLGRRSLLLRIKCLVLVNIGHTGEVLMSDQEAPQSCLGLAGKNNRLPGAFPRPSSNVGLLALPNHTSGRVRTRPKPHY